MYAKITLEEEIELCGDYYEDDDPEETQRMFDYFESLGYEVKHRNIYDE